ncbi:MAG TPA: hypothetical protein VJM11_05380 [Nevskiaceae bacterium]|nr:hypothetical protein [Nevskiaceae bacterium]
MTGTTRLEMMTTMRLRILAPLVLLFASGCTAHYTTPGGPARLGDINRADVADAMSRQPSPHFPANIVVVRVQAPEYTSMTASGIGEGNYTVVTVSEAQADEPLEPVGAWPSVAQTTPISRLLLPSKLESLEDLRLPAAKLQADILLVYTVDTAFRVQGRDYGPLSVLSLGLVPDRDAHVTATASAVFTDVRTGYTYGTAEATAKASGLASVWTTEETVDAKRIEAEKDALAQLVTAAAKTWDGILARYQ